MFKHNELHFDTAASTVFYHVGVPPFTFDLTLPLYIPKQTPEFHVCTLFPQGLTMTVGRQFNQYFPNRHNRILMILDGLYMASFHVTHDFYILESIGSTPSLKTALDLAKQWKGVETTDIKPQDWDILLKSMEMYYALILS